MNMKIAVATNAGGLEDSVSSVFGRCQSYTIIEADNGEITDVTVIPNQFASAVHGAGIQAGQFVAGRGVKAVISGNFGPNVAAIFQQSGIETVVAQGTVKDVVERYLKGELQSSSHQSFMGGGKGHRVHPPVPQPPPPSPVQSGPPADRKEEMAMLEEELRRMEDMLEDMKKRIEELKK